ncbi:MAG: molybdenum cofactor guanylyltransferase MobA [Hyphomicrobiales bacterium]|nr:molybdenum cofactor guanylyltransferase MobA [Hyphomicrobiales bacterium]
MTNRCTRSGKPVSVIPPDADGRGVAGLLLAGGRARRMGGGDKCLIRLGARTLLESIIERAHDQAAPLIINANGDPERFSAFGLPVVADVVDGYAGPLAGVLTALDWVHDNLPRCHWVASFAADTPFSPRDLVSRLCHGIQSDKADMACAASAGRTHPVFGLWPVRLRAELRAALISEGVRKIDSWTARYRLTTVDFAVTPHDPFFNINTADDLAIAETLLHDAQSGVAV